MTKDEFREMIVEYLGEAPALIDTGETGYEWTGPYPIKKFVPSEKAKRRARALSDKIECAVSTIYRYATGVAAPHPILYDQIKKAIEECISEENTGQRST